jgi:hypothetical protein
MGRTIGASLALTHERQGEFLGSAEADVRNAPTKSGINPGDCRQHSFASPGMTKNQEAVSSVPTPVTESKYSNVPSWLGDLA